MKNDPKAIVCALCEESGTVKNHGGLDRKTCPWCNGAGHLTEITLMSEPPDDFQEEWTLSGFMDRWRKKILERIKKDDDDGV